LHLVVCTVGKCYDARTYERQIHKLCRRIKQEYGISFGTLNERKITFVYEHYIAQNIKRNYEFAITIQIYVK